MQQPRTKPNFKTGHHVVKRQTANRIQQAGRHLHDTGGKLSTNNLAGPVKSSEHQSRTSSASYSASYPSALAEVASTIELICQVSPFRFILLSRPVASRSLFRRLLVVVVTLLTIALNKTSLWRSSKVRRRNKRQRCHSDPARPGTRAMLLLSF